MGTYLYGLNHASHDFSKSASFGKNIFTNAAPLAMAQYLAIERSLPIPVIKADVTATGKLTTRHEKTAWSEIIELDPRDAYFHFEGVFDGYKPYTHGEVNKSDVVVVERATGKHRRPLEIKLVVVPTSGTSKRDRNQQSCEIVTRPPTIEQLAFSIAHSYGERRRYELQEIIRNAIGQPNDLSWVDQSKMTLQVPNILKAAETIVREGIAIQTPLVMTAVWRSEGQRPVLDTNAFDVFVWTDLAFIQLFIDAVSTGDRSPQNKTKVRKVKNITRPARSLIWLIKSLWDYTTQSSLDFGRVHSTISYGAQSDKAGAFSGAAPLKHLRSPEFLNPRITRDEVESIIFPQAFDFLLPERRLDAALTIQHLVNQQKRQAR